jgi:arylsulfatase A-like enzyme
LTGVVDRTIIEADMTIDRILMIISDTLRWDYLGYNGGRVRTPNLDALAARSVVFDDHHAVSFPTMPARHDYLTGWPAYTNQDWGALPHSVPTVPAALSNAGYLTAAVVDTPFYTSKGFHYDRGFQYFYDMMSQPFEAPPYDPTTRGYDLTRAVPPKGIYREGWARMEPTLGHREADQAVARTVSKAEEVLEMIRSTRFFALVDVWDPHEPWSPPYYYVARYLSDFAGERVGPVYGRWKDRGLTERDLDVARALYSGEIEMVDRWLGQLLDKVERLGIADTTAILFLSDHGFYFGEHGFFGKMNVDVAATAAAEKGKVRWLRSPLYDEITHVPFVFYLPGAKPRHVTGLTSALDVAPTLFDLAGLTAPEQWLGRSLLPVVTGEAEPSHESVTTALRLAAPADITRAVDGVPRPLANWQPATITTKDWRLLYSVPSEPVELYSRRDGNLAPEVSAKYPEIVNDLIRRFEDELKAAGAPDRVLAQRLRRASI